MSEPEITLTYNGETGFENEDHGVLFDLDGFTFEDSSEPLYQYLKNGYIPFKLQSGDSERSYVSRYTDTLVVNFNSTDESELQPSETIVLKLDV